MLQTINVGRRVDRDDTLAVFEVDDSYAIKSCARLAAAYNPWMHLPSEHSFLATSPDQDAQKRLSELDAITRDPQFWPRGTVWVTEAAENRTAELASWIDVFTGLTTMSVGAMWLDRRRPLSELSRTHPLSMALADVSGMVRTGDLSPRWATNPLDERVTRALLLLGYERIVASKFLAAVRESEEGSALKSKISLLERAARFTILVSTIQFCLRLSRLTPWLELSQTVDTQFQLSRIVSAPALTWFNSEVSALLAVPELPWTSPTRRLRRLRKASTVWGPSVDALGVGRLDGIPEMGERESYARIGGGNPTWGSPTELFETLSDIVRTARLEMQQLETDGRMGACLGLLNAAPAGAAINIPLWGDDLHPWYADGLTCSRDIDFFSIPFQSVYPVDAYGAARTRWIGEPALKWVTPGNGSGTVTLRVEPEQPEYSANYVNMVVDPRQIASFPRDFQGEPDAEIVPHTPADFAEMFSLSLPELEGRVQANSAWGVLFSMQAGTLVPTLESPWYMSSRTRRTWLAPFITEQAPATAVLGIHRGVPPAPTGLKDVVDRAITVVRQAW
jgi:hypothetical protein